MIAPNETALSAKDYASDQEVRWCPGCGDYAILKAMQKTLADLAVERERTVFVSGIGCAARFPSHDPRPRAGLCHWHQAGQPRPRRLGDHR
jgi:pyruvate/2-oxoacid:ferredoxin oxidoreductase beta subunit